MSVSFQEANDPYANPLDLAEHVVFSRDLPYERISDDELITEISMPWGSLRVWLTWQPEIEGMMVSFQFDAKVPERQRATIYPLIAQVNEALWLGHFVLGMEEGDLMFRHTFLLSGTEGIAAEQIETLFDVAVRECGRFYPAFQCVMWGGRTPTEALHMAMFETVGEA